MRFGLVYLLGGGLIGLYFFRKAQWRRFLSHKGRKRCQGVVAGATQKLRRGPHATGYTYRLRVRYRTADGKERVAVSRNPIYSPKDYREGEAVEISYGLSDPGSFYICEDRARRSLDRFLLGCGLLLCAMGTAFWLCPELFH